MRKYAGMFSVAILVINVINVLSVGLGIDFIANNIYLITFLFFLCSVLLALIAEKGTWRKIAFWSLAAAVLLLLLFYVVMFIVWDEP